MTAVRAFRNGVRRVNGAPVVLLGLVLMTLLVAFPMSLVVRSMVENHLGRSAAALIAYDRANYDWWEEFAAQASGVGTTFTPGIIGFAAVLENTSGLLDNQPLAAAVGGATVAWMILWTFLSGGVIDRYARSRPTRAHGFFAACGTHFWRFLRLGLVAGCAYLVLFETIHEWLFESGYGRLTRDLTVERTGLMIRVGAYIVFSALLALTGLLLDYARIRIVVEDRRSAVAALVASVRFITSHAWRVGALFLLNSAAFLALLLAYAGSAPGAPRGGLHLWVVLAAGQAYIMGRHYVKLLVYASETTLFQGNLAHAAYTASPAVVWPDSPAVETITNAEPAPVR